MKPLDCPKCGGSLTPVTYQGVEIDRCQQCGGMWFDSLEAETLKRLSGSEVLDKGNIASTSSQGDRHESEIVCPRCQEPMMGMLDIDKYSIWYEKCLNCEGVWLDAGEFKQFKRNFQSRNILNLAKKIFQRRN